MSKDKLLPMEISPKDLTLSDGEHTLTVRQLGFLFKKTPKAHTYTRPAKGGGTWNYVTGSYVKKVLNLVFNFDWDFEIIEHKFDINIKQAYVLGKLTVRTGGKKIIKMQFGRVEIKFKNEWVQDPKHPNNPSKKIKVVTNQPLDIGNDLKAASTDCLKKCASELGIASDIYAPNEFKEIHVTDDKTDDDLLKEIITLMEDENIVLPDIERMNIERIIELQEVSSYKKALKVLKNT